jgi:hypothetical protein
MAMETLQSREYSSSVQIYLFVGSDAISVGRVGPGYAILRERRNIEPTMARLVVTIDEHKQEEEVFLRDGISEDSPLVRFI